MEKYYIYTDDMAVGYGKEPLIEHIEICLRRGEILTLIGPNGAGKSTILKSITRQLSLLGGTVYLNQQSMEDMSGREVAKQLAVVMTERIKPELMTCEDVVAMGRYPYTGRLGILGEEDHKKVQEALALVQAEELKDCEFTRISDGQKQRILLARAICQEPEIIVLDEPTSFLDIKHKLELLAILKEMVRKRKLAVVMSLHELDLAQRISDVVVCVNGKSIEKYGTPEEIFTSDYINHLYQVTRGTYNASFGCLELEPVAGAPKAFVIGGNGTGIPIYRRLQREGIPFAVGILWENDVDYPVARALAVSVTAQKAFVPMEEKLFQKAKKLMLNCQQVYCPLEEFGTMNAYCNTLKELAAEAGILVEEDKKEREDAEWTGRKIHSEK